MPPSKQPDAQTIADAYAYLLGRALVIRQERIDARAPGFAYNKISYNPLGSADFVNPNLDVAYLEAWLAVDDQTPVILEVPAIEGRYYTAQILDEWGEVITNINERAFPSKPSGKLALVDPGSTAPIPEGVARIALHSRKAKLLARVELARDPDGAVALQRRFKLAPDGTPRIAPVVALPDFDNRALLGAEIFERAGAIVASALDVSPAAAAMQQQARFVAEWMGADARRRDEVAALLRDKIVPAFEAFATTQASPYLHHWMVGLGTGHYGADFRMRAAANYAGIWANSPDEVVYFVATRDAAERPLDGGTRYVLHFPADRLPDAAVDAYWSITLVGVPDFRVVPNRLGRFHLNSCSPLTYAPDGSLELVIGPEAPGSAQASNWLPSARGKRFSLTFRAYVPKDVVKRGEWSPPVVTPA